jgi:hypothetical protein
MRHILKADDGARTALQQLVKRRTRRVGRQALALPFVLKLSKAKCAGRGRGRGVGQAGVNSVWRHVANDE